MEHELMQIYRVGYTYSQDGQPIKKEWFVHGTETMANKFLLMQRTECPKLKKLDFNLIHQFIIQVDIVELSQTIMGLEIAACDHINTIPLNDWGDSFCEDCGQSLSHVEDTNLT